VTRRTAAALLPVKAGDVLFIRHILDSQCGTGLIEDRAFGEQTNQQAFNLLSCEA